MKLSIVCLEAVNIYIGAGLRSAVRKRVERFQGKLVKALFFALGGKHAKGGKDKFLWGELTIDNPPPGWVQHCLLSDRFLCWKEPILVSYPFLSFLLLRERQGCKAKNPSSKWPGSHKSNAESKHVHCSFISIYYQFNSPHETDAKPKFASKISSLDVANDLYTFTTIVNQLGNPASFAKWISSGTTPSLCTRGSKTICWW